MITTNVIYSKLMETSSLISYNLFFNLSSDADGTILNINKGNTIFSHNTVEHVVSSSFPGCMLVKDDASFSLVQNYFKSCNGKGIDGNFAHVLYCTSKSLNIEQLSAFLCTPYPLQQSDSLIRFDSIDVTLTYYNSSNCYGRMGASGFSMGSAMKDLVFTYINVIDSCDHNSIELISNQNTITIMNSNILNATKNTQCVLNNYCNVYLINCIFGDFNQNFAHDPSRLSFKDCVIYKTTQGISISSINTKTSIDFKIKLDLIRNESYASCSKNIKDINILAINVCIFYRN